MQGKINIHIDRDSSEAICDFMSGLINSQLQSPSRTNNCNTTKLCNAPHWPDQVRGGCPIRALLEHYNGTPLRQPRSSNKVLNGDAKLRLHLKLSGVKPKYGNEPVEQDSAQPSPKNSPVSDASSAQRSPAAKIEPIDRISAKLSPKISNRTDDGQQGRLDPKKAGPPSPNNSTRLSPKTSSRSDISQSGGRTPSKIEPTDRDSARLSPTMSNRSSSAQSAQNNTPANDNTQKLELPAQDDGSARSSKKDSDLEEFSIQIQAMSQDDRKNSIDTEIIEQGDDVFVIYRI